MQFSKVRKDTPTLVQVVLIDAELYPTINDISFLSRILTPEAPKTLWKGTTALGKIVPLTVGEQTVDIDYAFQIFHKVLKHWAIDTVEPIELNPVSIAQLKVMNTPTDILNNLTEELPQWGQFPK